MHSYAELFANSEEYSGL